MIFIIHIKYHPYFANIDRIMDSIAGIIIAGTIRKVIVIVSNSHNINQGIPYFETVWIGVPNIQQFSAALRAAFLTVPNVIEVISLITSQENNTLTYSAIIRTTFGAGNVIGSV